jgi:2,5-diketo-D-gluconate reductase A
VPPLAPTLELPHGARMPHLGLGTWPMGDREAERVVAEAIGLGYRLIDTAHAYGNERGVGRGMRASGVPLDELFVTTKLNAEWHGRSEARDAFEMSAERLGVDRIDLFLIHWPNPWRNRYADAFQGLVDLMEAGLVRAVGLSNFKPEHTQRVIDATGVTPDVNQIELNPRVTREAVRAYHAERGIVTESWSPIGKGSDLLADPAITAVAARHERTPAQVVLRWHIELGLIPVPKSSNPERLAQNLAVFDFSLTPDEVSAISALDQGESAAQDSDSYGH